jgi:DNA-binding IclR family transcriptional regulator
LEALEKLRSPAGVRALEASTSIPKATAQRLLDVLEKRGYVQKEGGRYALAVGTIRLTRGFLAGDDLMRASLPVLQELTAHSGETCSIYVRQGFDRILVQRVESPHPLRFHTPIGERLPLHLGASGQILCGALPDEVLRQFLDRLGPVRLASGKIISKKDLWARIQEARRKGYAIGVGERYDGVSSVAAPVVHPQKGVIAAINIAGPSSRMPADKLERLSIDIRGAAREIAEALHAL